MASRRDKEPVRAIALGDTAMATVLGPEQREACVQLAKGFVLTVNGLRIQGQPTFAAGAAVGELLRMVQRADGFAIGDWALYMEQRFGEQASQLIDAEAGWNLKTVNVYKWLAERVMGPRRRMDRLGIKHHLIVAPLAPAKQKLWLDRAANDDGEPWTAAQLAQAIKDGEESLDGMAHWVVVLAANKKDAEGLMESLSAQGRTVKLRLGKGKAKEAGS